MGVCVSMTVVPLSRPRCRVAFDRHAEPFHSAYFASHWPSLRTTDPPACPSFGENVDPRRSCEPSGVQRDRPAHQRRTVAVLKRARQ